MLVSPQVLCEFIRVKRKFLTGYNNLNKTPPRLITSTSLKKQFSGFSRGEKFKSFIILRCQTGRLKITFYCAPCSGLKEKVSNLFASLLLISICWSNFSIAECSQRVYLWHSQKELFCDIFANIKSHSQLLPSRSKNEG